MNPYKVYACARCGRIYVYPSVDQCSYCDCREFIETQYTSEEYQQGTAEEIAARRERIIDTIRHNPKFMDSVYLPRLKYERGEAFNHSSVPKWTEPQHLPKCIACGSTNVRKIDGLERVGSVAMLGLFSRKINKSFKCKDCGMTF